MAKLSVGEMSLGRSALAACFAMSLALAGCQAPTDEHWVMSFLTPAGKRTTVRVSTGDIYSGLGKPVVTNEEADESARTPPDATAARRGAPDNLRRRKLDTSVVVCLGTSSGWFDVVDEASGKVVATAATGFSYSYFLGISPNAQYMAYSVPNFWGPAHFYVHHLASGRRAVLNVDPRWRLVEWDDDADAPRSAKEAKQLEQSP
jgi:hypothetical protein